MSAFSKCRHRHRYRHPREDPLRHVRHARFLKLFRCQAEQEVARHADILATILARMSVSWNAACASIASRGKKDEWVFQSTVAGLGVTGCDEGAMLTLLIADSTPPQQRLRTLFTIYTRYKNTQVYRYTQQSHCTSHQPYSSSSSYNITVYNTIVFYWAHSMGP